MRDRAQAPGASHDLSSGDYLDSYTTPNRSSTHQYYGSEMFNQIMSANARNNPYYNPPPPLPKVAAAPSLPISPNEPSESSKIYQGSPYLSEAPALGTGSGSSESSASTTSVNRPVPARSAFMCFSDAKGKEISKAKGAGGKVCIETIYLSASRRICVTILRHD